ncbi:hypothetical protein [Marinisporobacter balticus]|uniref:WD40 repeat protein n=1 Tax=Marinisporobacter balticus TaxID=2018667 RepID=A0A4R2KKC1_9FIRM|nr:hypothetical protein [Marinisporobacter balticus]TCO73774.1 hypothetical protein EV214_1145 [Marinisporobacter balticus]
MKIIRKKVLSVAVIIILILFIPLIINRISILINSKIIDDLSGEIYYTKRVDESLALYKSDANMKNEKLIYNNKGNGKLKSGESNDNIGDFGFFPEIGKIEFEAVYNGKWSILGIKEGETKPIYIRESKEVKVLDNYRVVEIDTDYIRCKNANLEIYEKQGSLYMKKNGQEKCIKRFIGMYSEKFTGYRPVGLSPDGKYLVYSNLGAFLGTIIHEKKQYIMDLKTGKSTEYISFSSDIQWVLQ